MVGEVGAVTFLIVHHDIDRLNQEMILQMIAQTVSKTAVVAASAAVAHGCKLTLTIYLTLKI